MIRNLKHSVGSSQSKYFILIVTSIGPGDCSGFILAGSFFVITLGGLFDLDFVFDAIKAFNFGFGLRGDELYDLALLVPDVTIFIYETDNKM